MEADWCKFVQPQKRVRIFKSVIHSSRNEAELTIRVWVCTSVEHTPYCSKCRAFLHYNVDLFALPHVGNLVSDIICSLIICIFILLFLLLSVLLHSIIQTHNQDGNIICSKLRDLPTSTGIFSRLGLASVKFFLVFSFHLIVQKSPDVKRFQPLVAKVFILLHLTVAGEINLPGCNYAKVLAPLLLRSFFSLLFPRTSPCLVAHHAVAHEPDSSMMVLQASSAIRSLQRFAPNSRPFLTFEANVQRRLSEQLPSM